MNAWLDGEIDRDNQINWRAGSWKDKLRDPNVYVYRLLDIYVYYVIFLPGKNSLCPCLHPYPPSLPLTLYLTSSFSSSLLLFLLPCLPSLSSSQLLACFCL